MNEFFHNIAAWISKSAFLIATVALTAMANYFLHVKIGKEELIDKAFLFSVVLSFTLAMVVAAVWSSMFGHHYETAVAVSTALIGKELVIWLFINHDKVLNGIAGKFKINLRDKNK